MVCFRMRGLSVLALLFVFATSPASAANSPDGQPRPTGYPETPTRAYGPTPDCLDPKTDTRVDCEWYGFAHQVYPALGESCLTQTRAVFSESSYVGVLEPYTYYLLTRFIFDTTTNDSYCLYGCFNMGDTPPTPAGFAPPPPAPVVSDPPPASAPAFPPDGQPRPTGYPETPTRAYGPTPDCLDPKTDTRVDCEWYGFAHQVYPALGASCLTQTRAVLSESSYVGRLEPYTYYFLDHFVFDTTTNDSYCLYGCFNMGDTPPTPAGFTPPPGRLASPPPPAPVVFDPPPAPVVSDPPPAPLLFTPPPPRGLWAPPTTEPMTPPSDPISSNAAGFVRPVSGIVSLVVSGALLALNLLLC